MRRTVLNLAMHVLRRLRKKNGHLRPLFFILLLPSVSLLLFILLTTPDTLNPFHPRPLHKHLSTINDPASLLHDIHEVHQQQQPHDTNSLQNYQPEHTSPTIVVRNVHGIPTRTTRWPTSLPHCTHPSNTTLRLILLTMNRPSSLSRLLSSLSHAHYLPTECIALDIWIDHGHGVPGYTKVLEVSRHYDWKFGIKSVHERMERAGLYEQWIYTWEGIEERGASGKGVKEMAVILEDDLEVSPMFWRWLKEARERYGNMDYIGAYTLQRASLRPRQIKGKYSGSLKVPEEYEAFAYLLLGTWGFAPKPETWVKFRRWYEDMRGRGEKPYVDGLMPTEWYKHQENKEGIAKNMWSMWWIKFADEKRVFTLYANMKEKKTLAANWKEKGLHYSKGVPKKDFEIYEDEGFNVDWPKRLVRLDWAGRRLKSEQEDELW